MNWQSVSLGDEIDVLPGYSWKSTLFNTVGKGLPIIRIQNVDPLNEADFVYWDEDYNDKYLIKDGDVLLTLSGSFRIAVWNSGNALINQRIVKLTPSKRLHKNFFLHVMRTKLEQIEAMGRHALVNNVSITDLKNIKIPLPPLAEQRRIAAILDCADALRTKRRAALAKLDTLLQATFLDMFGDPVANLNKLPIVPLSEVCTRITDGTHQPPKWAANGVPFLFVSNVVDGELTFDTKKFISIETYAELNARCPVENGDILYTIVGSYGNAAIVRTSQRFSFQRHIAHIKPDVAKVDSDYLLGMLQSPGVKRQADAYARGVAQKTLNLRELKNIKIFLPTREQQERYRGIRNNLIRQKNLYKMELLHLNHLFHSLQQRAFRGELSQQGDRIEQLRLFAI